MSGALLRRAVKNKRWDLAARRNAPRIPHLHGVAKALWYLPRLVCVLMVRLLVRLCYRVLDWLRLLELSRNCMKKVRAWLAFGLAPRIDWEPAVLPDCATSASNRPEAKLFMGGYENEQAAGSSLLSLEWFFLTSQKWNWFSSAIFEASANPFHKFFYKSKNRSHEAYRVR